MDRFKNKHILSTENISLGDLGLILDVAKMMEPYACKYKTSDVLKNKVLATLFFEPSTRTRLSFETAMIRLGGQVVTVESESSSSLKKGETFLDTGRVVCKYADVIAMRHPQPFSVAELASGSSVPVINAGDGPNQHPTQALMDIYTMYKEKGTLDNLTIGLLGDFKYGRTVHSLINLMALYSIRLILISPSELKMPEEIIAKVKNKRCKIEETKDLEGVIGGLDVLYVTRIQQERFENLQEYQRLKGTYQVSKALMAKAKKDMCVMHPLPRVDEILPEVDEDPRALYFKQVQNGIPLRMALLCLVLGLMP